MPEPLPDAAVVLDFLRRLTVADPEQVQLEELRHAIRDGRVLLPRLEEKLAEIHAATCDMARDFRRQHAKTARLRLLRRQVYRWLVYPAGSYAGAFLIWTLILLCWSRPLILGWVEGRR